MRGAVAGVDDRQQVVRAHPDGSWSLGQSLWEDAGQRLWQSKEERILRERHARFFMAVAEGAAPHLAGPEQRRWAALISGQSQSLKARLGTVGPRDSGRPDVDPELP